MYHEDEVSVEVELLVECGRIAQSLRSLERAWTIDLKELQRQCLQSFGQPSLTSTPSVAKRLNDIFDDELVSEVKPELVSRLRYLEETVIKIYHQHELLEQIEHTENNPNAPLESNMNNSTAARENNDNDLTTSPIVIHEPQDDQQCEKHSHSGTSSGDRGREESTTDLFIDYSEAQGDCHHHHVTETDLRMLIRELKRKVDFTEKMNWMSLSNRPTPPPNRKTSLPKHSDVKKKFLEICNTTLSEDVKVALRLPSFDSYDYEDFEILLLLESMFIELNFIEKFHLSPVRLREWLYEVYKHYNDVPFHNFRHCFCVSQMMYAITWQANLISRIGEMEVFILLVSCICHDLDHPGYNNVYQINAKTELALRYNDISPLENHHCSIAFRVLEVSDCNFLENFTRDMYKEIRDGIIRCILATDMGRHNDILTQFRDILPVFDYNNPSHKNLLCMVLIKVADISNEARPLDVAEPWLDRLLQEFFAQSAAEKLEGLPVTPFMDPDKVSKPGGQVRFIGLVLLPLFESLGELLPELVDFIIIPVREALDFYKRLNDAAQKNRKSLAETENSSDGDEIIPRSQSGMSVRSRRSITTSQKSNSRNSEDEEPMMIAAELHDLPEGSESGDSETATEVDVAEKHSKFKVETESRNKWNTQVIHRKGHHRDKRPSMVSEMGSRIRGSYDSTVYYHQRLSEQDALSRAVKKNSIQGPTTANDMPRMVHQDAEENDEASRVQSNNNCSLPSKNVKPKLSSSVSCTSNSPKSIISRLRQLTGRLSFSFDKESRRMSGGTQTQIIKTSASKNNNMTSIGCNAEPRNRACSLDVPAGKYNSSSGASSNNGSHRSLSSNRNDDADESSKKVPGEGDTAEI